MSVVDKVVEKKDTKVVAEVYPEVSLLRKAEIAAKTTIVHVMRSRKKYENAFPKPKLFTIDEEFGGWTKAQKEHFNGGMSDQISKR